MWWYSCLNYWISSQINQIITLSPKYITVDFKRWKFLLYVFCLIEFWTVKLKSVVLVLSRKAHLGYHHLWKSWASELAPLALFVSHHWSPEHLHWVRYRWHSFNSFNRQIRYDFQNNQPSKLLTCALVPHIKQK